ncbi:hypothetical protein QOZ96_003583 [Brevundimonas nasdae]|uniref:hypothetical protein n=1 Tax=Brevundimonas nasdae TaxID=172043 RepID=UPI00191479BE|nr:hypothetical protein [Brevundimonas nasdae]MBK6024525.1 hypothetical protein [Brevundimonas nasdae]MDQ0453610.1 hypothetical protein [Brevundimonas nasdae]
MIITGSQKPAHIVHSIFRDRPSAMMLLTSAVMTWDQPKPPWPSRVTMVSVARWITVVLAMTPSE